MVLFILWTYFQFGSHPESNFICYLFLFFILGISSSLHVKNSSLSSLFFVLVHAGELHVFVLREIVHPVQNAIYFFSHIITIIIVYKWIRILFPTLDSIYLFVWCFLESYITYYCLFGQVVCFSTISCMRQLFAE